MTLKLATALMAGTLLAGCATTDDGMMDGMQTSASTRTTTTANTGTMNDGMAAPARAGVTANTSASTRAMTNPMVGGVAMMANMNIVQNAMKAPNLTTLVRAVQAADLAQTLQGPGPFTVFAPTNEAFDRAPAGLVSTLLQPNYKPQLQELLKYHVVQGSLSSDELMSLIRAGGGSATIQTLAGEQLVFTMGPNGNVMIQGKNNSSAYITTPNVKQSNGYVHVINGVLAPNLTM